MRIWEPHSKVGALPIHNPACKVDLSQVSTLSKISEVQIYWDQFKPDLWSMLNQSHSLKKAKLKIYVNSKVPLSSLICQWWSKNTISYLPSSAFNSISFYLYQNNNCLTNIDFNLTWPRKEKGKCLSKRYKRNSESEFIDQRLV